MAEVFNGGVPTAPAVQKLKDRFGAPEPGKVMKYAEIADTIEERRESNRFRSVVEAWRKALEHENGILLRCVPNTGYEALDAHGRIYEAGRTYKHGIRRFYRAGEIATGTDRDLLTDAERKTQDHLVFTASSMRLAHKTAPKLTNS